MTLDQYNNWEEFRKKKGDLTGAEAKMVAKYYADVYKKVYKKPCTCDGKIYQNWINKLNAHFESLEKPTQ